MAVAFETLCRVAAPGIEVVTEAIDGGGFVIRINGGRLDGETFFTQGDPEQQHHKASLLARMSGWGPRRIGPMRRR